MWYGPEKSKAPGGASSLEETTLKAGAESARSHDKAFKDSDLESIESWNSTLQILRNTGRSHSAI